MEKRPRSFRAVVSVHDVMPKTLPQVKQILKWLQSSGVAKTTLLVVPGTEWTREQIDWLLDRQEEGLILAGHGWIHHVQQRASLYHKLHGVFLSRMVAEHLSRSEKEISELIQRCFDWFVEHGFDAPELYVPPAWAMGPVKNKTLDTLPFRYFETMAGVYDSGCVSFTRLPLTGYEADTALRKFILAGWNRLNEARAKTSNVPLRITIHPHDLSLKLARQVATQLGRADGFLGYDQLFERTAQG